MSLTAFIKSPEDAIAVGQAMLLAHAFLEGPPDSIPRSFAYAPDSLEHFARRRAHPFGMEFGVCGVGVLITRQGLRTAILHNSSDASFEPKPVTEVKELNSALRYAIPGGSATVPNVVVLPVSDPEMQAAPGDAVSSALNGTAGVQLNWGPGLDGILTAGHVCKSSPNATVAGVNETVVLALDPTNHGSPPEADVSVIRLTSAVPAGIKITSTAVASGSDMVTIATRSRKLMSTAVMGQLQWLWIPKSKCTCGQIYMTTQNVTIPGDSGAPVRKGTDLVGHVIAGSPGMTTYIQSIDYQLQEIRKCSGFSAATL